MTAVRRRILRPPHQVTASASARHARRVAALEKERTSLDRWMKRLRRAFHAVEKQQQRVARLERAILGRNAS